MFDDYKYAYYYTLRTKARERVVDSLNKRVKNGVVKGIWRGIKLGSIDQEALEYARKEWPKYYGTNTHDGFEASWERLWYKFMPNPANYNIAIWQECDGEKVLQGLALGKPSRGKSHLTVNWVERSFAPSYFRGGILLPVLACAEEYAKLLGCERVLVKDAVDRSVFEKYGYTPYNGLPHRSGSYLAKELDYGGCEQEGAVG